MKIYKNKTNKPIKLKYVLIAMCFLFAFLAPSITNHIRFSEGPEEPEDPEIPWYDPSLAAFFYNDTIDETTDNFNAYNESYIVCKIHNSPYANFTLDGTIYYVTYGMNYIPIEFSSEEESYTVTFEQEDINNDVYDWFVVQPVIVDEGFIEINPTTPTSINFDSGGLISFFLTWNCTAFNNFTYDELYVEYDGIVINEIREDWTSEFEIDPLIISSTRFNGRYIQYNIFTNPGSHTINLKGNATIDYKIVVSDDWDGDGIPDEREIQDDIFELGTIFDPSVYGYFMMGNNYQMIRDPDIESGVFALNIPEVFKNQFLRFELISGSIANITVDDDDITFKGKEYTNTMFDYSEMITYGNIGPGNHYITWDYTEGCLFFITFYINGTEVPIIRNELVSDADCDGLSDLKETTAGSNYLESDTDSDGLIDGYDSSVLSSLELNNSKITEIVIPTNKSRDSLITFSIKRPENDYLTKTDMLWRGIDVMVVPMMRTFGNSSINSATLSNTFGKEIESYDLTGTNPDYGDSVPDPENGNLEYMYVNPSVSEASLGYSLFYDIDNTAKSDSKIVIRFDFVWAVIAQEINTSQIIHTYNINESIMLQTLTSRELDSMNYILASPDSMIESDMIFNLIQNSNLGSFSDFELTSDIVGSGSENLSAIVNTISGIRDSNPISVDENGDIDETEVIYFSYWYSEYDVLMNITNQIYFTELTESQEKTCRTELFVANFIPTYISESDISIFSPNSIQNDNFKVCYLKRYGNFTESSSEYEERFDICDYPVYMNNISFQEADVLEIVSSSGFGIPLDNLPETIESTIHDKISLTNSTTIENKDLSEDSLLSRIAFDVYFDTVKMYDCTRILDIPLSDLVFNSYSWSWIDTIWSYFKNLKIRGKQFFSKWKVLAVPEMLLPLRWSITDDIVQALEWHWYQVPVGISESYVFFTQIGFDPTNLGYIMRQADIPSAGIQKLLEYTVKRRLKDYLGYFTTHIEDPDFPYKKIFKEFHDIIFREEQLFMENDLENFWELHEKMSTHQFIENIYEEGGMAWHLRRASLYREMMSYFDFDLNQQLDEIADKIFHLAPAIDELQTDLAHFIVINIDNEYDAIIERLYGKINAKELELRRLTTDFYQLRSVDQGIRDFRMIIHSEMMRSMDLAVDVENWKSRSSDWKQRLDRVGKTKTTSRRKIIAQNVLSTAFDAAISIFIIYTAIFDFKAAIKAKEAGDMKEFGYRFNVGLCKTLMAGLIITARLIRNIGFLAKNHISPVVNKRMKGLIEQCSFGVQIFGFFINLYQFPEFYENIIKSEDLDWTTKRHMIGFYVAILIADVAAIVLTLLGYTSGFAKWIPYIGFALDILLMVLMFVFFPPKSPKSGGVDASNAEFDFPELSIKRHGGLTVGDEISFSMDIESTGSATSWVQICLDAGESGYSDWDGDWDDGYEQTDTDTLGVTSELLYPKSCLDIKFWGQIALDLDGKEIIWDEVSTNIFRIPILDADIDDFYDDLTEHTNKENLFSYRDLEDEFRKLKETYDHNATAELANKLSTKIDYDFLDEEEFDDWDDSSNNEGIFTEILRPNERIGSTTWDGTIGGTNDASDAEVKEKAFYDNDQVKNETIVSFGTVNGVKIYLGMDELSGPESRKLKKVQVFAYGNQYYTPGYGPIDGYVYFRCNSTDDWSGAKTVEFPLGANSYGWWTATWDDVNALDDLDDMEMCIKAVQGIGEVGQVRIDVIYFLVTYETSETIPDSAVLIDLYKGHNSIVNITSYGEFANTSIVCPVGSTEEIFELEFWLAKDEYSSFLVENFFRIDRTGSIWTHETTPELLRKRPIEFYEWTHFAIRDLGYSVPNYMEYDLYVNGIKVANDVQIAYADRWQEPYVNFTVLNDYEWNDYTKGNASSVCIDAIDSSWFSSSEFYEWKSFAYEYTLENITYYEGIRNDLKINTSISTDLRENVIEMSTSTHIADFDFDFALIGTENPAIDIELFNVPEGFEISTTDIDQDLEDTVSFEITDTGNYEYAGTYFFEMNVTMDGDPELIYYEKIPFIIPYVGDISFERNNIIYEENDIDSGMYTSTYDFLGESPGSQPDDWYVFAPPPDNYVEVKSSYGNHEDVIEFSDDSSTYRSEMYQIITARYNGTLEFWIQSSNVDKNSICRLAEDTTIKLDVGIDNGKFFSLSNGVYEYYINANIDTWYHIRIDFECGDTDYFNLYINNKLLGDQITMTSTEYIDKILFSTGLDNSDSGYDFYVDAIGYSWDSEYILGENMYTTDTHYISTGVKQVSIGDLITVEFKTNTYSEVQMGFHFGASTKTYTILPRGNGYSTIQTRSIIMNETAEFTAIQFTEFENNYFDIQRILITENLGSVSGSFNLVDITNNGNVPEYFTLDFSGIMDTVPDITSYDTGWVESQTQANVDRDGERPWSYPNYAESEDGSNAIADTDKNDHSDWLRLTNFYNGGTGYDIPIDAVITGIEVKIKRKGEETDMLSDDSLRLRKTSGQVGDDKASATKYPTTLTWATYGSSTDNWSASLTVSDLNSADFGIDLSSYNYKTNTRRKAEVDAVFIKIHYKTYGDDIEVPYESQVITILPDETKIINLDLNLPTESFDNIMYREVVYNQLGSNNMYHYIDNFEIDEIYIASILNKTYNIIGNNLSCNKDELHLEIIPEVSLTTMEYSLDGNTPVSFSDNSANVILPKINGMHSIQVFGLVGETEYESELINFTIQYPITSYNLINTTHYSFIIYYDIVPDTRFLNYSYSFDEGSKIDIPDIRFETFVLEDFELEENHNLTVYGTDLYGTEYTSEFYEFYSPFVYNITPTEDNFSISSGSWDRYGDMEFLTNNNSETQTGYNSDITMIEGSKDSNDNMHEEDGLYTTITSESVQADWYDANWEHRKSIIIYSAYVPYSVTNFPMIIKQVSDSDLSSKAQVDGDDILFTSSDGVTKLNHEIEYYGSGTLYAWVKVPNLPSSPSTTLYMYYGNSGCGSQESATSVWNTGSNYKGVWHLPESSTVRYDSTSYHTTLYNMGATNIAAKIYSGDDFDGLNDYLYRPDDLDLDFGTGDFCISAWVKTTQTSFGSIISKTSSSSNVGYSLDMNADGTVRCILRDNTAYRATSTATINDGNWHFVAGYRSGDNLYVMIDAAQWSDTGVNTVDVSSSIEFRVGNRYYSSHPFDGIIDEVRASNTARGWSWLRTCRQTQLYSGTCTGFSGEYDHDIPDTELTIDIKDFAKEIDGNSDILGATVSVKWYTGVSETVNIDIYNFDTPGYENKISAIHPSNTMKTFDITSNIQDYINASGSDEFLLRIYADNYGSQYYTYIDYIAVQIHYQPENCSIIAAVDKDLDFQIDMQIDDEDLYFIHSLSYSYKSNVSAIIAFDIWDWSSSTWIEIENCSNYESFDDDVLFFDVGSDYINSTNGVRFRFQCFDNPTDFQIEIDRFRLNYYKEE